jgi:hypothetical protein
MGMLPPLFNGALAIPGWIQNGLLETEAEIENVFSNMEPIPKEASLQLGNLLIRDINDLDVLLVYARDQVFIDRATFAALRYALIHNGYKDTLCLQVLSDAQEAYGCAVYQMGFSSAILKLKS